MPRIPGDDGAVGTTEKRITLAAVCGFVFGIGSTVASMALPQAYSNHGGRGPIFATICEVANETDISFVNLKLNVHIRSWNVEHLEKNQSKIASFAYEVDGSPVIPQLPAKGNFTFYIWNFGQKYHEVTFGKVAEGTSTVTGRIEEVKVFPTRGTVASWPNPLDAEPTPPSPSS